MHRNIYISRFVKMMVCLEGKEQLLHASPSRTNVQTRHFASAIQSPAVGRFVARAIGYSVPLLVVAKHAGAAFKAN